MRPHGIDIVAEVIGKSTVIKTLEVTVCECELCLTVVEYIVNCPVPGALSPSLIITGDVSPLYFSVDDDAPKLIVNGDENKFGSVQIEFLEHCEQIVVDGTEYEIGIPGAGTSLEFGGNELIGFTPARL